jgi:hypothetical protein
MGAEFRQRGGVDFVNRGVGLLAPVVLCEQPGRATRDQGVLLARPPLFNHLLHLFPARLQCLDAGVPRRDLHRYGSGRNPLSDRSHPRTTLDIS